MIVASLIWVLAIMCAIPSSFSYIRVFKVNTNVTFQVSSTSIHKIIHFIVRASIIDRRNVQHDFSPFIPFQFPLFSIIRSDIIITAVPLYCPNNLHPSDRFEGWFLHLLYGVQFKGLLPVSCGIWTELPEDDFGLSVLHILRCAA